MCSDIELLLIPTDTYPADRHRAARFPLITKQLTIDKDKHDADGF
jgi:hypothetical protein